MTTPKALRAELPFLEKLVDAVCPCTCDCNCVAHEVSLRVGYRFESYKIARCGHCQNGDCESVKAAAVGRKRR